MRRAMSETMDTSVFPQAVLIRWSPLRCRMTDAAFRRQSLQPFGKALPAENFPLPTGVGWVLRLPARWSLITVERSPLTVCQGREPDASSGFRLVDMSGARVAQGRQAAAVNNASAIARSHQ